MSEEHLLSSYQQSRTSRELVPTRYITKCVPTSGPPEELGHFRILLRAINFYEDDPHPTIWFGARDEYSTWDSEGRKIPLFGVKTLVWSRNPDDKIQNTVIGVPVSRVGQQIDAGGYLYKKGPYRTLGDFDHVQISIYVTKPLVEYLAFIGFAVNNYLLIGVPIEHIATGQQLFGNYQSIDPDMGWPEALTTDEEQGEWVELCIKGPDAGIPIDADHPPFGFQRAVPWDINFDSYTPIKEQLESKDND